MNENGGRSRGESEGGDRGIGADKMAGSDAKKTLVVELCDILYLSGCECHLSQVECSSG